MSLSSTLSPIGQYTVRPGDPPAYAIELSDFGRIGAIVDFGAMEEELWDIIVRRWNSYNDLLSSCKTLLEICRWKCSPLDEVVLPGGQTNENAMIEAIAAINKAEGSA